MNLADKISKDKSIQTIEKILKNFSVYIVGGYIRDKILNIDTPDKDLVVENNSSENIANILSDKLNGVKILLDKENQIYRVVLEDKINYFDITETKNIEADATRRDFKINSIYYNIQTKKIYDPLNGIDDIKNKIISTVDTKNFLDDPLRILRTHRFSSVYNFKIEEKIKNFIKNNGSQIQHCAKERINYELIKLFSGKNLINNLIEMKDNGLLKEILPRTFEITKVPKNSHHHLCLFEHSLETIKNLENKSNPYLNLSAFMHDIGKPKTWTIDENGRHRFIGHDVVGEKIVQEELRTLKFSNKQIEYISKLVRYHMYPALLMKDENVSEKAKYRFLKRVGNHYRDIIDLAKSDRLSTQGEAVKKEDIVLDIQKLNNLEVFCNTASIKIKSMPKLLNGNEIMKILNIPASKKIGEILQKIEENQLTGKIKSKEEAIKFLHTI